MNFGAFSQTGNDSISSVDTTAKFSLKDTLKKPKIKVEDDYFEENYIDKLKKKRAKPKYKKPAFNFNKKRPNLIDSNAVPPSPWFNITSGEMSVGTEYGFLPFSVLLSPPDNNTRSTGLINFQVKELPFNASYYISTLGYLSGMNNQFKIQFDVNTYLQNMQQKLLAQQMERSFKIDSLNLEQQGMNTKLDYYILLQQNELNAQKLRDQQKNIPKLDTSVVTQAIDTLNPNGQLNADSLRPDSSVIPIQKPQGDGKNKAKMDSIQREIAATQQRIKEINEAIERLKMLNGNRSYTEYISAGEVPRAQGQSPFEKFLMAIRKFEIGLTNPDFSEFLVNKTMVKGINTEFQFDEYYVAFAYGTAVNVMLNSQINQPNIGQQFANFLNIKNVDSGRKITALKGGYGQKESTHIYAGFLYGKGKQNYSETISEDEQNLAVEIDGRIKFLKYHTIDLIYGRSATQVKSVLGNDESLLMQVFNFNDRTNAFQASYGLNFKGTSFGLKYRLIDPFYQSFGVQFIRNDRVRYEAKIRQKLGKKVVVGAFGRRENDNLLGIHPNKNVFLSYGADLSVRPTRHWLLRVDYRPFVQQINAVADTGSITNNSYIVNTVSSYNNRFNNTYLTVTGVYSYYFLAGVSGNEIFRNLNLNVDLNFNNKISNAVIYNRFDATDTLVTLNNILENNLTYMYKRFSITGIAKIAFSDDSDVFKSGYGLRMSIPLFKKWSVDLAGERILLGDFYSNLLNTNQDDFPYYFSGDLIFRF